MRQSLSEFLTTAMLANKSRSSAEEAGAEAEPEAETRPEAESETPPRPEISLPDQQQPVEAEAAPPAPAWQRWRPSLAVSAFAMSVVITLISAFSALQGSEIVVLAPDQVLLYRDGEGDAAVLTMAMRLELINSASAHGDVLVNATLQPRNGGPKFRYQSLVRPVFSEASATEGSCTFGSRCIQLPGLYLIETVDDIVALPGGSARATFLSFPATEWNCDGTPGQCRAYANFDQAVRSMGSEPIDVTITLSFHSDGDREVRCLGAQTNINYLQRVGWIAAPCRETAISDPPLL